MDEDMGTGGGLVKTEAEIRSASIPEKLRAKKGRLEVELHDVNAALGALADNPELERVLHLVSRAGGRY